MERIVSIDLGFKNVGVCEYFTGTSDFHFRLLTAPIQYSTLGMWEWARELFNTLDLGSKRTYTILEEPYFGPQSGSYGVAVRLHCLYTGLAALLGPDRFLGSNRKTVSKQCQTEAPDLNWESGTKNYRGRKESGVILTGRILAAYATKASVLDWSRFASAHRKCDDVADAFLNLIFGLGPEMIWGKAQLLTDSVDSLGLELLSLEPQDCELQSASPPLPPVARRPRQATRLGAVQTQSIGKWSSAIRRQPVRKCRQRAKQQGSGSRGGRPRPAS